MEIVVKIQKKLEFFVLIALVRPNGWSDPVEPGIHLKASVRSTGCPKKIGRKPMS